VTLDQLVSKSCEELSRLGLDRLDDGRIAAAPTARTVRFLRQADVVSRPEGAGPAAEWGGLHLEQIITARALQAAGCSIGECAERMRGLDPGGLAALRDEALKIRAASQTPQEPPAPPNRHAWQVSPDYLLISTRPGHTTTLSNHQLQEIRRILNPNTPS
jgi:hypothetical protein